MADIRVSMDGPRDPEGVVEVDGHNIIGAVRNVQFAAGVGEVPRLFVEVLAQQATEIEATGVEVTYVVVDDPAGWLRSIDPELLGRAALEGAGMGDSASSAELILKALIRMAEGLDE